MPSLVLPVFSIVTDEDGQKQTKCPCCNATGAIVEVDHAVRFNELDLNDPHGVIARMGEEGDWDFDHWLCEACSEAVDAPQGFKIADWV